MTKISLDTNVLIYNHGIDGDAKQLKANTLLPYPHFYSSLSIVYRGLLY